MVLTKTNIDLMKVAPIDTAVLSMTLSYWDAGGFLYGLMHEAGWCGRAFTERLGTPGVKQGCAGVDGVDGEREIKILHQGQWLSCDLGCQSWWKLMRLRQMWTAVCKWPCTARALGAFQSCGTAGEVLVLEGTSPCIHDLQNRSTTTTTTRDVKLTMCPQISCFHVVLYICYFECLA